MFDSLHSVPRICIYGAWVSSSRDKFHLRNIGSSKATIRSSSSGESSSNISGHGGEDDGDNDLSMWAVGALRAHFSPTEHR